LKIIISALVAAGMLTASTVSASQDLAKKNNCLTCHQTDKKLVGPSYQDIAKKYSGNKAAAKTLAAKVKNGGKGAWGDVPMPPNPTLKEADAEALVKWILAGAH
jgi:cytochrome c